MDRRTFVLTGSTIGSTIIAGCLSDGGDPEATNGNDRTGGGDGDGETNGEQQDGEPEPEFPSYDLPAYAEWPPVEPRTRDFVMAGHTNAHYLHQEEDNNDTKADDDDSEEDEEPQDADDVLLTLPFFGGILTMLWFSLGLMGYPWVSTLGSPDEPDGMETTAFTMTEGTFVFHGEYDVGVFSEKYAEGYDQREEGAFTVFEGREDEPTEEYAYAVSSDAVVTAISPEDISGHDEIVANLENAVENHESESGRILDYEDGSWLFETTGPADMATCFWQVDGLEPEHLRFGDEADTDEDTDSIANNPVLENVDSFVSTVALPEEDGGVGGDMAAARFAALYPAGEVPSEDKLREALLADDTATAADVHVTTGEEHAHVEIQTTAEEIEES